MDTFQRVRKAVAKVVQVPEAEITRDTLLTGDLPTDSMELVEIGMALEEEFDITLNDEAFAELKTIGQIVDWVDAAKGSLV